MARSPSKRSRSRSRSPARSMSMSNMYQDKNFQIYLLVMVLVAVWFWYYARKDVKWFTAISPKAPSWGNSEVLIIFIVFLWYVMFALICLMYLKQRSENSDAKMVTNILFLVATVQIMVFIYLVSNAVQKFSETFTNFVIAGLVTLFLVYKAYLLGNRMIVIPSVLALGSILYMIFWSYHVKNH